MQSREDRDPMMLSVVIPMFNEAASLDALFARLFSTLDSVGLVAEVICVNDGSDDDTWEQLQILRVRYDNLVLVNLSRNFGKEIAITAGLDLAEGNIVVVMDGDVQHPPELIPEFMARWREGYDVVYGIRRDRKHDSAPRRWMSRWFYRVFNSLSKTPITPDAGDFRLMDRKVVEAIRRMRERARFMKGIYSWVGFKSVAVEFEVEARQHGRSSFSPFRLFALAFDGLLSFSTAPLRLAMFVGAAIAVFALSLGGFYLVRTLMFGIDVPGYASIIVSTLALSGFTMLQLGLMGLYLGRIYEEVKARPLYLVREIIGKAATAESTSPTATAMRQIKGLV